MKHAVRSSVVDEEITASHETDPLEVLIDIWNRRCLLSLLVLLARAFVGD